MRDLDKMECQEFTLYPGDFLYMPKGAVHVALADEHEGSGHLTIGLHRDHLMWEQLWTHAVDHMLATQTDSKSAVWMTLASALREIPDEYNHNAKLIDWTSPLPFWSVGALTEKSWWQGIRGPWAMGKPAFLYSASQQEEIASALVPAWQAAFRARIGAISGVLRQIVTTTELHDYVSKSSVLLMIETAVRNLDLGDVFEAAVFGLVRDVRAGPTVGKAQESKARSRRAYSTMPPIMTVCNQGQVCTQAEPYMCSGTLTIPESSCASGCDDYTGSCSCDTACGKRQTPVLGVLVFWC
jgi:hypothetical protein